MTGRRARSIGLMCMLVSALLLVVWAMLLVVIVARHASAEPHLPRSSFWAAVDELAKPGNYIDAGPLSFNAPASPVHRFEFQDAQGRTFLSLDLEHGTVTWDGATDEVVKKFWATIEAAWPAMCPGVTQGGKP